MIRNVSLDGAMLTCEEPEQLPQHIYLMIHKGSQVLRCEVLWHKSHRVFGVRFGSDNSEMTRERLIELCALATDAL